MNMANTHSTHVLNFQNEYLKKEILLAKMYAHSKAAKPDRFLCWSFILPVILSFMYNIVSRMRFSYCVYFASLVL